MEKVGKIVTFLMIFSMFADFTVWLSGALGAIQEAKNKMQVRALRKAIREGGLYTRGYT